MPKTHLVTCRLTSDSQSPRLLGNIARGTVRERLGLEDGSEPLLRIQRTVERATSALLERARGERQELLLGVGIEASRVKVELVVRRAAPTELDLPDAWSPGLDDDVETELTRYRRGARLEMILDTGWVPSKDRTR
ncbi:MAG: hypothetical protein RL885_18040 [Planctomycetota bacterium]